MHELDARKIIDPARFTVGSGARLNLTATSNQELYWEIFQGRLLDATATRERRQFDAWDLFCNDDGPVISLLFDKEANNWHITRGLLTYGYEAYDEGGAILTRETQRWTRELVGSTRDAGELPRLVFLAVVGTSRLPLTSLEAPLPQFSLGQLGYFPKDMPRAAVKNLEWNLRCETLALAEIPGDVASLREVFLDISLSPYTGFVERALGWASRFPVAEQADFLAWLLRLQWRHLNAYDLHVFHHRGANYPDALLVDSALRRLVGLAESCPQLFAEQRRRRGLRLGWLLRVLYTGHRVPEQPTSPGENRRVLPDPFVRLPEEQIINPHGRPRALFEEPLPLGASVEELIIQSLRELSDPLELSELGTALLLDRPLGLHKSFGEPDDTPMLAYLARSKKLIARHLQSLNSRGDRLVALGLPSDLNAALDRLEFAGLPLSPLDRPPRPGVVSLNDAFQTADDFIAERTLRRSLEEFANYIGRDVADWRLVLPKTTPTGEVLRAYDADYQLIGDVRA